MQIDKDFRRWLKTSTVKNHGNIQFACKTCGKTPTRFVWVGNDCPKCQWKAMKQTRDSVISVLAEMNAEAIMACGRNVGKTKSIAKSFGVEV